MQLTTVERLILEQLADHRWRTPSEVHSLADGVHVQIIRGTLKNLAGRSLVERGGWGDSERWGEYRITRAGLGAIADPNQLELGVGA